MRERGQGRGVKVQGRHRTVLPRGHKALSAEVRVVLEPEEAELGSRLAESPAPCRAQCRPAE